VIADLSTPAYLTTQLAALLAQPEQLVDFGKKARTRITGHFSLGAMADAYAALYRALADRR